MLKYNNIKGPKHSTAEYIAKMSNDDLKLLMGCSARYGIKINGLMKKMAQEIERRHISLQLSLF